MHPCVYISITIIVDQLLLSSNIDGVDYLTTNEVVTFLPGETCVSVNVSILDDNIPEQNETFVATLKTLDSFPGQSKKQTVDNVSIGDMSTALGIIIDDDTPGTYTYIRTLHFLSSNK